MIPRRLLPQTIDIAVYLGTGAEGDVWADPVTVPARVEYLNKLVRDNIGDEVVSGATVYLQPIDTPPLPGSLVTLPGDMWDLQRTVITYGVSVGARKPELLTIEVR